MPRVDCGQAGRTPLFWASANGHLGVAKLLLERGAAVDAKSDVCTQGQCLHDAIRANASMRRAACGAAAGADVHVTHTNKQINKQRTT